MSLITREDCLALDRQDPLATLREQFALPAGQIYLDGNSLGVAPKAAFDVARRVVEQEWAQQLIQSWNTAGWIDLPRRVGDKIGQLVGAAPGEVVACDSTSVNLFKVLSAAMRIQESRGAAKVIVSERDNFPTDLYIAESLCRERGWTMQWLDQAALAQRLADGQPGLGLLMLTHVHYRSGRMHDMAAVSRQAHALGALAIWDLAHSAGAVPVELNAHGADFAVGCGYKYLNGGPGAPAFVWAHPQWVDQFWQPLSGWMGHAAPFQFTPDYQPQPGIQRYLCGTPSVVGMSLLEAGVDSVLAAGPMGGMPALRRKSLALTVLFRQLLDQRLAHESFQVVSPAASHERGSQISFSHPTHAYAIVQALIRRGVVGDFRAGAHGEPDLLRFGFTPLYVSFADVWDAVEHLVQVMARQEHLDPALQQRHAVT